MNGNNSTKCFHIWQQNVAKSLEAQHDVLAKADPKKWDLITLQEPYLDSIGLTQVNMYWNVIYPSNKNLKNQNPIRSVILVNTNIHSSWIQQILIPSSDLSAIKISTAT